MQRCMRCSCRDLVKKCKDSNCRDCASKCANRCVACGCFIKDHQDKPTKTQAIP